MDADVAITQARNVEITVARGELRWGYLPAAVFHEVLIVRDAGQWRMAGAVQELDTFRASQRPLKFVVQTPKRNWVWPIETLQITGGSFSAILGPKEP